MVNIKELHPESSPRAAFGARVRRWRERHGWKQEELGDRVGCSSQHISALETGRKPSTLSTARRLDVAFGTANTANSFEREHIEMRRGSMLEGFPEYVGYEARATEIRLFEIGIIPGLLQTREYAEAMAEGEVQRGTITAEQAAERVAVLMDRQAALVRVRPPLVIVVLDEGSLHHAVGGAEVMNAQLQRLVEVAAQPHWIVQVAPFSMGARRSFNLSIYLLTLADRSVALYAESQAQGHFDREPTAVLPLLGAYHQLQAEALSQAASVAMVHQLRKGMS
ncbi:putative DNA-binding protein [Actinacidiphila reveromycinica]|uniref:Putative DNA-binding protein n=1 Tax=Actinacidiphila reveromycinica TaxID=659352 RepID=A0A7U3UV82_9ACTN|nr:helix-turn-helix transcriptional regulator [Streptomyces sp. SN-593]BBB00891.1 putative DNA-binding protein [Streptomyces sp. SN-593]